MMRRPLAILVPLLLAGVLASPGVAQTPFEVCAQDSLRLFSPDEITTVYDPTGRPGVRIRWPEIDDEISTCIAVVDTEGYDVSVALDGVYLDEVDRALRMTCANGGEVGSSETDRVSVGWSNVNQTVTGIMNGTFNLSNNGGVLAYGDGAWRQLNSGLPMYLSQTDIRFLQEAPDGSGGMIAHLRGDLSRGLWRKADAEASWVRVGEDIFPDGAISTYGITALVYSPDDGDVFAVGTRKNGLYVTRDGGETFTQYKDVFSSTGSWNLRNVSDLSWETTGNLLVAIDKLGLYRSTDGGESYVLLSNFLVSEQFPTGGDSVAPEINTILDLGDGDILVGVETFGVYESRDNGASWDWIWNSLLNPDAEPKDVTSIIVSPYDENRITVGTVASGLYWSPNRGDTWISLDGIAWSGLEEIPEISAMIVDASAGRYLAMADGYALLECAAGDTAWSLSSVPQPGNLNIDRLLLSNRSDIDYLMGSYGGGIYTPGTQIYLSDTINRTQSDEDLMDLDLGVYISFEAGVFDVGASFRLILQDFQGYAVWRSSVAAPDDMMLIGLYDKSNPETCIEGYCGDESYNTESDCYADKRAACFDFSSSDYVEFFDGDIYEGFTYYYAVGTFDYGNIATSSPSSLVADQLFSSRYPGDTLPYYTSDGNRTQIYVRSDAADAVRGDEIYAYPNPLRLDAGFSGAEGVDVRFTNLPPNSRIQVFTLDGDLVADLDSSHQAGNLMTWTTDRGGERLASGVYIYKVEMPEREDFYGKVVVIR